MLARGIAGVVDHTAAGVVAAGQVAESDMVTGCEMESAPGSCGQSSLGCPTL